MAFPKDTLIYMADGIQRKIKELRIGDRVLSVNGKIASVSTILTGVEQELLQLTIDENTSLLLAPDSVIKTQEGFKPADHLFNSDLVECSDGKFVAIQKIEPIPCDDVYNDSVYVLCLDGGETHYANNLAVGSMELEQQFKVRKS